jgi:Tfp pilus assembly protein PilF
LPFLEEIVERSPSFLEAQLQAAEVAVTLFQGKRDSASYNRALHLIEQAGKLAPNYPRLLRTRFNLELANGQAKAATDILSRLEDHGDSQT